MARVLSFDINVSFSKIFKSSDRNARILTEQQIDELSAGFVELAETILGSDTVIVEVSNTGDQKAEEE